MIALAISFAAGILFAVGLTISGMINPNVVKGFLNIFGDWNYSLVFVMAGAVGFNFITYRILKNKKPMYAHQHFLPDKTELDKKLVLGSALFGIGWGLVGVCPGPAIVNLVKLDASMLYFVMAMLVGMNIFRMTNK